MLDRSPVPDEVLHLVDCTAAIYKVVNKIVGIAEAADDSRLRVQRDGFPYERDISWALLDTMYEVFPDIVVDFIRLCRKKTLAPTTAHHLGIVL